MLFCDKDGNIEDSEGSQVSSLRCIFIGSLYLLMSAIPLGWAFRLFCWAANLRAGSQ